MPTQTPVPVAEVEPTPLMPASVSEEPTVEATASAAPVEVVPVAHVVSPATSPSSGMLIYDVESSGTAPEKRAPYGDSYDINRLERPFQQDMTYIPDMDIDRFTVNQDAG
jgi:hypothetical protein